MNGFIKKAVAGSCLGASLALLIGCDHYRDLVDPCWPERYSSIARHTVRDTLNVQADRGHMLEQTVWNWYFETDPKTGGPSDKLNGAGMAVLARIGRTLPRPDGQLFLQNAQDIPVVDGVPAAKLLAQRDQLNKRRIESIQKFMATQVVTHGPGSYLVAVHDFTPTGLPEFWPVTAFTTVEQNIKGSKPQAITAPTYATK